MSARYSITRSFRPAGMALILATCALLSGCGFPWLDSWWGDSPKPEPPSPATQEANNTGTDGPMTLNHGVPEHIHAEPTTLRIRVYQLIVPLGAFSLNEKIWRQLDEDTLDSTTSVLLAQNGFRAGMGLQERWTSIYKLLDGPGTSFREYLCQTDGRSSVQIVTRQNQSDQNIFYVDRDGQNLGRTFELCDNALRLSISRQMENSDMKVQVEPFVITGTVDIARHNQETGVVRTTRQDEQTFHNLRIETLIPASKFLILAPLNPKKNPFSVGTRFLSATDQIPATETILVFVPIKKSDTGK